MKICVCCQSSPVIVDAIQWVSIKELYLVSFMKSISLNGLASVSMWT